MHLSISLEFNLSKNDVPNTSEKTFFAVFLPHAYFSKVNWPNTFFSFKNSSSLSALEISGNIFFSIYFVFWGIIKWMLELSDLPYFKNFI